MLAAQSLGFGLSYAFHLVVARALSPAVYGELQALLAVFAVTSMPLSTLMLVVAATVAHARARSDLGRCRRLLRELVAGSVALTLVAVMAVGLAPHLALRLLSTSDPFAALSLALDWGMNLFFLVASAFLLGAAAYRGFNLLNVSQNLMRLCLAWLALLIMTSAPALGALRRPVAAIASAHPTAMLLCAHALAALLTSTIALLFIARHYPAIGTAAGAGERLSVGDVLAAMGAQLAVTLLLQADILYVQRYLPEALDEGYAAISMIAKLTVYLPSTLATVLFPIAASPRARPQLRALLSRSTMATGALAIACVGLMLPAPRALTVLLFGAKYAHIATRLPVLAAALMPCALLTLYVYTAIARKERRLLYLAMAAAAVLVTLLLALRPSLSGLMAIIGGVSTTAALVAWLMQRHATIGDLPSVAAVPPAQL
jgi:O-antigen/teichoic acid export membrane protein